MNGLNLKMNMGLNKEYKVDATTVQDVMFQVSEFITLIEKFKSFNVNKDYSININKVGEDYTANMVIKDEKQVN